MRKQAFRFEIVFIICIVVATAVTAATAIISLMSCPAHFNTASKKSNIVEYADGWKSSYAFSARLDTSFLDVNELNTDKPFVFTKVLTDVGSEDVLFISSHNLVINVYIDGEPAHITAESGEIKLLDGLENYILVKIPEKAQGKEISLEIFKTRYNVSARIDKMLKGAGSALMRSLIIEGTFPLVVGEFLFFIGIGFVLLGVFVRNKLESYIGNIFFGVFMIFMSFSIVTDTAWAHLMISNPVFMEKALRICHIACIPAFLAFIDSSYETEHYYPLKILAVAVSVGMAAMLVLDIAGVISIISLGYVVHLLVILAGALACVELIMFMVRTKGTGKNNSKLGYSAVFVLFVFIVIDILIYYNRSLSGNEMLMSCFGVLFLTAITIRTRFSEILEMIKLGVQAGKIGEIAFTDANTGIGNAAAFKAKFDDLEANRLNYRYIGIIQFDVNNLKIINDTKGHDAGDLLIKSAASIINSSFGNAGSCYRTGGDEFVAIICNDHAPISCEEAIFKFNRLIDKFNADPNKPFELRIAHGVAYYQNGTNEEISLKEVHKMADERMYSNKKMLKARYAHSAEEAEVR